MFTPKKQIRKILESPKYPRVLRRSRAAAYPDDAVRGPRPARRNLMDEFAEADENRPTWDSEDKARE